MDVLKKHFVFFFKIKNLRNLGDGSGWFLFLNLMLHPSPINDHTDLRKQRLMC
jgi:hypothetical protein